MNTPHIIMFLRQLKRKIAGGSRAVLDRAKYFVNCGYSVTLIITEFSFDADKNLASLRKDGILHKSIDILYLWTILIDDDIFSTACRFPAIYPIIPAKSYSFKKYITKGEKNIIEYYIPSGILQFKIIMYGQRFFNYQVFNDVEEKIEEWRFTQEGKLFCIDYYSHGEIISTNYYADGSFLFLSVDKREELGRGKTITQINNLNINHAEFLAQKIDSYFVKSNNLIIIADGENISQNIVRSMQHSHMKAISVLHNNHTSAPYMSNSPTKKSWEPFFNDLRNIHYIVCLTNRQKEDLLERYPNLPVTIIQHAIEKQSLPMIKRIKHSIIFLGRITHQKQVHHLIDIYKIVKEEITDAQLHIYGEGSDLPELKSYAEQNNLLDIFFHGFTKKSHEAFASCSLSILTSHYEGFPLTLGESMSVGTPFVTYDINYGPDEIIQNGVNGVIVPQNDIILLATSIIELFKNSTKLQELSREAEKIVDEYTQERYINNWKDLINNIL